MVASLVFLSVLSSGQRLKSIQEYWGYSAAQEWGWWFLDVGWLSQRLSRTFPPCRPCRTPIGYTGPWSQVRAGSTRLGLRWKLTRHPLEWGIIRKCWSCKQSTFWVSYRRLWPIQGWPKVFWYLSQTMTLTPFYTNISQPDIFEKLTSQGVQLPPVWTQSKWEFISSSFVTGPAPEFEEVCSGITGLRRYVTMTGTG